MQRPWLRRRRVWVAAGLIVVVGVTLAVLPEVIRRVAIKQIRVATGREVTIDDVDLNVFTGRAAVKKFRLADRGRGEPFVEFERLDVRLRLLPLLTGRVHLREVSLQTPTVRIVRTGPTTFNFSDLLEPSPTPKASRRRGAADLTLERFALIGGTLVAEDQAITPARTWRVDELSVEAHDLATRATGNGGAVAVSLKLGPTPIALKADSVRLTPAAAHAALTIGGFDLALLLPYLPHDTPVSIKSGRFNASLTLDYGPQARLGGDMRLDQLVVLRRGQTQPFVSVPALTVSVKDVDLVDGRIAAKNIIVAGDPSIVDGGVSPPARLDLTAVRVALEGVSWPPRGTAPIQVVADLPKGGRFEARGTVGLIPVTANLRVLLRSIDLATFQPYVPITGLIAGKAEGDLAVTASVDRELTATVRGKAGVNRLSVSARDHPVGDRPAVEVERAEATGLDIAWPTRVTVARVLIRKPAAVIERDEQGALPLRTLLAARDAKAEPASAAAPRGEVEPAPSGQQRAKLAIDVGEILVEEGSARFVDHTSTPAYAEDISRIAVTVKGLSNAPGKRAQLVVQGVVGGGSALDLRGAVAPLGETLYVDLTGELRDFRIPEVNSFLDRIIAWIARDGRLTTRVHYRIDGDQLEATNEIVVGRLELVKPGERDEVKRRLGLPLGLIVALLKDTRGEIRVNVPIAGRLGAPEFSFREAIWTAVKNVVVNILKAPFKLIGRLFTKGDTIEALSIDPVRFEAGSAAVSPAMDEHLQRVGGFLESSPYVKLTLVPIITGSDLSSLKTQEVTARIQQLQREERITEFSAAAARVFRKQFPERPAPKGVEEIVAALRASVPEPEPAARALAARRGEVTKEALQRAAAAPAERLIIGEAVSRPDASGDGSVEVSIAQ